MENQLIREQVFDVLFNYIKRADGIYTESDCATVRDEICLQIDQSQFTADEAEEHINQEVEKRIAERMPSENDKRIEADRLFGELTTNFKEGMYSGFFFGCDFLRSRLTQPNNSETESRRTLTDTEIKAIFNNGEPLCKQLHNEQQMWRDIQNKERDDK